MARSIPQLTPGSCLLGLVLATSGCAPARAPIPLPRGEARVTELPATSWSDGTPDASGRDVLRVAPGRGAELRFRLPRVTAPERAYLRLHVASLDAPRDAHVAVERIDPALAWLPRPPLTHVESVVTLASNPLRLEVTQAVRESRRNSASLVLRVRALDEPVTLASPRAIDVRRQPRLELWHRSPRAPRGSHAARAPSPTPTPASRDAD